MWRLFLVAVLLISYSCEVENFVEPISDNPDNNNSNILFSNPSSIDIDTTQTTFLFVGNSLTFFNDMPEMFEDMANEAGKNVLVEEFTIPGTPLRDLITANGFNEKLLKRDWDYIILQSDDKTAWPDYYQMEIDIVNKLKVMVADANINPQLIYQMDWGYKDGPTFKLSDGSTISYTFEEYLDKIYTGTIYVAGELNIPITPVGHCWLEVFDYDKNIELFRPDRIHPTETGSFIIALTHYSLIFKESSENLSYSINIGTNLESVLKSIVSKAVLDDIAIWDADFVTGISDPFASR